MIHIYHTVTVQNKLVGFFFGGENNGSLVLRQPFSGWSIPAPSAEDSPMNVCVLGHIATTRWPTVQTRGEFNVRCQILQVTLVAFWMLTADRPSCHTPAAMFRLFEAELTKR